MKFLFVLAFINCGFASSLQVDVSAKSALLMDAETGAILYEKNGFSTMYPASTTKIASALYALEKKSNLDLLCRVSQDALKIKPANFKGEAPLHWNVIDGSRMGLVKDEIISLESLLHGLMKVSGNDAANVIAENLSLSVKDFVDELNTFVKSLGCKSTHFVNPHGLHHESHVTTAFDMALITKKALTHNFFLTLVSSESFKNPKTNKQSAWEIFQSNGLMKQGPAYYSKAIGVKTGYHTQALWNLVAAAEDKGRRLIAVIFGCDSKLERYTDAINLFEAAFREEKVTKAYFDPSFEFTYQIPGIEKPLKAQIVKDMVLTFYPSMEPKLKCFVKWMATPSAILKGDKVGVLELTSEEGQVLLSEEVFASQDLELDFFEKLRLFFF